MEFDDWYGWVMVAAGLAGLAWFCLLAPSRVKREVEGGVLRRTDYPWWGLFYVVIMVAILGFPLTGRVQRGDLTLSMFFGFACVVAALGVYTGRLVERGARGGRGLETRVEQEAEVE